MSLWNVSLSITCEEKKIKHPKSLFEVLERFVEGIIYHYLFIQLLGHIVKSLRENSPVPPYLALDLQDVMTLDGLEDEGPRDRVAYLKEAPVHLQQN